MIAQLLTTKTVKARIEPTDWKMAGRAVGALLAADGGVEESYIEKMIEAVEKYGPYIVITPGVALFHSRPDNDVHKVCLALATVPKGILFNAGEKDPVKLLIAFATTDNQVHLDMLRELMELLKNKALVEQIVSADTEVEIIEYIQANFK